MGRFVAVFAASLALCLSAAGARAGDVTATVKGQILVVKGDDQGADLLLAPPVPLSRGASAGVTVQITPQGGTTLNGAAGAANFDGIVDVKMTLGDGENIVMFQDLSLDGKLTFKGGNGIDTLTIQDTDFVDDVKINTRSGAGTLVVFTGSGVGDDLSVKSGSGADALTLGGPVGGTTKLSLGAGANSVVGNGPVGDDFFYKGGAGADSVALVDAPIGGQARIQLSQGANVVTLGLGTPIGESLKLKGGTGNDNIALGDLPIGQDAILNLSAGNNTLTLTDTTIGDDLIVKGKSGDDAVTYAGNVTVGGETKFILDGGTNTNP